MSTNSSESDPKLEPEKEWQYEFLHEKCLKKLIDRGDSLIDPNFIIRHDKKMMIKCGKRNHTYQRRGSHIKDDRFCPYCEKIVKGGLTDEQRAQFLEDLIKIAEEKGGKILSKEVLTYHSTVLAECKEEHLFRGKPSDIFRNLWCHHCMEQERLCSPMTLKQYETYMDYCKIVEAKDYTMISHKFENEYIRMKFKCNKNGHIRTARGVDFKAKDRDGTGKCAECAGKQMTGEIKDLIEYYGYTWVDERNLHNLNQKIEVKCPREDNHTWNTLPAYIKNDGLSCPYCKMSRPEKQAEVTLRSLNIDYQAQFTVPNFHGRYDFYFECKGIKYVIEIDGPQHFTYSIFFHHTHTLQDRQNKDVDKTLKAFELGFKVIRVAYTDDIDYHIRKGLESPEKFYYSDVEMYDWLIKRHPMSLNSPKAVDLSNEQITVVPFPNNGHGIIIRQSNLPQVINITSTTPCTYNINNCPGATINITQISKSSSSDSNAND